MDTIIALLKQFIDLFLHLDKHLAQIIADYGSWAYGVLFAVIFCETGLVVTPFLPGDSLLFAAGAFAAKGSFNVYTLLGLLWFAAVLGDNVNYFFGRTVGPKVFQSEHSRIFNRSHLLRTEKFYDKYGGKTLIIARFMPILRTFAPFVAGIGRMRYPAFLAYSVVGGGLWMSIFLFAGYFFGNLPAVKHNFTLVILAVIALSLMPPVIEFIKHRRAAKAPSNQG